MSEDVDTERPAPPQRVIAGRYALGTELGRGGMGVVWRAEDRLIARPVAVKEMRLGENVTDAERSEFEQRIMREARTAGRLNDPGVVTVYDVVHAAGSVFIVMELVEAPTLTQLVQSTGALSPRAVAHIGRQVLSALEAAHRAGVVHRDVKPSNIMVAASGRAKLTDFGLAQAADDPTLTRTGAVAGSPAYLAPERLSGQAASPASDLWSLGAVLYFAIEGRPAFERDTTAATFGAVLNEVPYLTNAQGPLAAAVSGMLAASPAGRLTAPQVRTLLDAASTGDGTPRGASGVPQRTMMTPPGTVSTATVSAHGDLPSPPGPQPGRRKRSRLPLIGALTVAAVLAGGGVAGSAVFYHRGYDRGLKAQAADLPASDAVQVYTLGGSTADFPSLNLSSNTCQSGPPFAPGTPTYQSADCSKPHDLEQYYATDLVNTSYSIYGADGNGPVPYPGVAELTKLAKELCWQDRLIGPSADPAGSHYTYAALVPTEALWAGSPGLPDGWRASQTIYCVMWNAPGQQLPADVGQ